MALQHRVNYGCIFIILWRRCIRNYAKGKVRPIRWCRSRAAGPGNISCYVLTSFLSATLAMRCYSPLYGASCLPKVWYWLPHQTAHRKIYTPTACSAPASCLLSICCNSIARFIASMPALTTAACYQPTGAILASINQATGCDNKQNCCMALSNPARRSSCMVGPFRRYGAMISLLRLILWRFAADRAVNSTTWHYVSPIRAGRIRANSIGPSRLSVFRSFCPKATPPFYMVWKRAISANTAMCLSANSIMKPVG